MSARAVAVTAALLGACGTSTRGPLSQKAGDDRDEGAGELARASLRLHVPAGDDATGFDEERANPAFDYGYGGFGGDLYGGDTYGGGFGGDPYGGVGYASWRMPQWSYNVPNRMPRYNVSIGLPGAIEGTVTWNGQLPPKAPSACGPIDNPTLRVSHDKALRGVVVYIEKVAVGRGTPYYSRPATVGGILAKRGCALVPAVQIVAPLPGSVAIHGDATRTRLRIGNQSHDLQEAGLVQVEVKAGATKVESDDGKLAPAWVLGLDTPYYAITDDAGRFRLDELAPGTYELTFWQPPVTTADRDGRWSYGAPIVVKRSVKVDTKTAHVSVALPGR
jgi:hypothetical protein